MPENLDAALAEVRTMLLDPTLVRAVAAGSRRGRTPSLVRARLRTVEVKAGPQLQIVTDDGSRPYTRNVAPGAAAGAAVDALLAEPFGNWHVESAGRVLQLRVTKRGEAQVHRSAATAGPTAGAAPARATGSAGSAGAAGLVGVAGSAGATRPNGHDRAPVHLLDPGDPLFEVIGGNAAKRRQVDAFLRALDATLGAPGSVDLPKPLRVVDLGCGNAYLTFAAFGYLSRRGIDATLTGVDVRPDQRARNTAIATELGWSDRVSFVAGTNLDAPVDGADVVLALHACDTATDEALARAVGWGARYVLAAPCCHHDIAAQLRRTAPPEPYQLLVRQGILRERFADVLTDALRAALLRLYGYRVEVVEFVDSTHTPRNLLLRGVYTGARPTPAQQAEYRSLVEQWRLRPALADLLPDQAALVSS